MQSRANGSFAFLCHEDHVDTLLCASGKDGLFIKSLSDDSLPLELLWLDPAVVLGDALNLAKDRRMFGLADWPPGVAFSGQRQSLQVRRRARWTILRAMQGGS